MDLNKASFSVIDFNNSPIHSRKSNIFIDSGFDSVHTTPTFQSCLSNTSSPSSSTYNSPTKLSPSKQFVADLNGLFYASLRSPLKSPFGSKEYVRERDLQTANLLRSPSELNSNFNKEKYVLEQPKRVIRCREFKSFNSNDQIDDRESTIQKTKTNHDEILNRESISKSPTQEEFTNLLFKHHLPSNPDCLIGRHMGIDHVDILNELDCRSMLHVIDKILSYLNPDDYAQVYRVSKPWKYIIQADKKRNKERVKYIKFKKQYVQASKENILNVDCCEKNGILQPICSNKKIKRLSNGAFTKLDVNCLNNSLSKPYNYEDFYEMDFDFNKSLNLSCKYSLNQSQTLLNQSFSDKRLQNLDNIDHEKRLLSPQKQIKEQLSSAILKVSSICANTKICSYKSKKNLKRL